MRRADRIAWRGLAAAVELVVAEIGRGNYQAAIYLINRCLGTPTARIESTSTVDIILDASQLQRALDQARLAVLQAQDMANLALPPAPLDTATTPE